MAVHDDLRVAGGAGGEEHEHVVVAGWRVIPALIDVGRPFDAVVEGQPAIPLSLGHDAELERRRLGEREIDLAGRLIGGGTDYRLDAGGVEAVDEVLLHQLMRRRDGYRAHLAQAEHGVPELDVAAEDEHDPVALPYADGLEIVGGLCRHPLHVGEGEAAVGVIHRDVDHGEAVGLPVGHGVDDVEGEVEPFGVPELDVDELALLVLGGCDEVAVIHLMRLLHRSHEKIRVVVGGVPGGVGDDGEEHAVLPSGGDHAVRLARIVVDGVAGTEDVLMPGYADLQLSRQHIVELLARVHGERDGLILRVGVIFRADEEGL